MAYVNVAEWKTDQVCEWLKGLENSVLPYVHSFSNHNVNGQQLLNLRPEDLAHLGVSKLGHQEIILEAVEYLRNFHYELDRENLQLLSLRLSCLTHSLFNELSRQTDSQPVSTQTLADVASIVSAVKPLVCWLDRPPFSGQLEYNDKKAELLKLSLEMATCAQRDRFAEKPIEEIRTTCGQMAKLADYVVQDIADPMILQPASLDLATLKKRPGDDLGFCILPSFHGAHQIAEIKFGSAAHQCGKMEEGDEIVQVNYQTVVGWERKNVLELFRESPAEVLLTLKRRPRHTKVYGQIYIKPYRLPSNKKTPYASRWHHNLPSPRPELLTIPDFTMPLPKHVPKDSPRPEPAMIDTVDMLDNMPTDSSDSDSEIEPPSSVRLYLAKPRNTVQRRATITGASPTTKHGIDIERFWRELKQEHSSTFQLRDKAASCAHGLNNVSSNLRPQTCLGIEQRKKRHSKIEEKKVQFKEKNEETEKENKSEVETQNAEKESTDCDNKVPLEKKCSGSNLDLKSNLESKNTLEPNLKIEEEPRRGKLDKSHSTPAYDFNSGDEQPTFENLVQASDSSEKKSDENLTKFRDSEEVKIVVGSVVQKINDIEKHLMKSNEKIFPPKVPIKKNTRESFGKNTSSEDSYSEEKDLSRESSKDKTESSSSYIEDDLTILSLESEKSLQIKEVEHIERAENNQHESKPKNLKAEEKMENSTENCQQKKVSARPEVKPRLCPPEPPPRKYFSKPVALTLGNLNQEKPKVPERPSVKKEIQKKEEIPKKEELSIKEEISDRRRSDRFDTYSDFVDKSVDFIDEPSTPDFKNTTLDSYGYSQIYDSYSEEKVFPDRYEPFAEKFANRSFNDSRISNESRISDSRTSNESKTQDSRLLKESRTLDSRMSNESRSLDSRNSNESRTLDSRISNDSRNLESRMANESRILECRTLDARMPDSRADILDFPDGPGCSKLTLEKPRTLEKDRGVVNRAMMVARSIGFNTSSKTLGSPKSSRKRNMALAKRRNISTKELSPGDLEGWLTYRSRGAGGAWAKAWFVLKGASLFRFKTQDGSKADCLIALTGFTASQASEVKSRKHAFKIYHTGTVFYFAADTEDSLLTWLDAVSKTTVGADTADRSSGLFSETDESDEESKKLKSPENKDKGFGSLKKNGKKDQTYKEQSLPAGASLDRKYLKFLGKSQNVPVPTAQFRSYRRVLPSSTPRKQDSVSHSPELPVMVAGSTFYGLNASRSANDVPSSSQDMGDYRRTSDRFPRTRRNDELQGFITLEEFMLSRQDEDHRGTPSPRFTPLTSDHVHVQHRTFDNLESARMRYVRDLPNNNGVIYGFPKNYDESSSTSGSSYGMQTPSHTFERRASEKTRDSSESKSSTPRTLNCMRKKKSSDGAYYDSRQDNHMNEQQNKTSPPRTGAHGQINPANYGCEFIGNEFRADRNNSMDLGFSQRRMAKNDVYSGSSGDLASHSSDTFKVPKATVSRNGSFNLADCRRDKNHEKKIRFDKNKLKHVGQYQPPPILNTPFEQEGMRAAFEMHLDKGEDAQKKNKLKNFFSNKSPQKPSALEIPKENQKTLLGSPRLHRALFRDKSSTQPKVKRSGSQSPGDSGISQSLSSGSASQTLSHSYSSVSSVSDWSPDAPLPHGSKCSTGHPGCQKRPINSRNFTSPPTLPYIPPPTSPPPDYPGLEYPPVFEPGTYSLSDASFLRNRSNKNS